MTPREEPLRSQAGSESPALAKVVARQRAEIVDLQRVAALLPVLERAKGAVMVQEGCSAEEAYDLLLDRSVTADRTLVEECWLTLGAIRPLRGRRGRKRRRPQPVSGGSAFASEQYLVPADPADPAAAPGSAREAALLLGRLGLGLATVRDRPALAHCLLDHLGGGAGIEAVLVWTASDDGMRLTGHAGIDAVEAARWDGPAAPARWDGPAMGGPTAGAPGRGHKPVWVEGPEGREAYDVPDGAARRWPARAWLPVESGGEVDEVVAVLRGTDRPFTPVERELLVGAVQLCAGRMATLDSAPPRRDPSVESVQQILDALSGSVILLAPLHGPDGTLEDFRIEAAAPESVDVAGRRGRGLVGLRVLECYPTFAGTELWDGYREVLATGKPFASGPFTYEEVVAGIPHHSSYSLRVSRLGHHLVVSWIRHDVADRQERRLAAVQRLGNLGWADWNLVTDTITWSPHVFTIFDRDEALGPMRLEDLPESVLPEDLPQLTAAAQRLLRDGAAIDQPFRITTSGGVRHLRIVAEAVTDADGTPLEVHGFFQDLSGLRDAELALVSSERAVSAQRGLLQAERRVAARLQQALLPLPTGPVRLAGLWSNALYHPAERGISVGGDWYSAIELPDGDALFVIGDVMGHGISAVATMAQLRFTAKGMIVTGSSLTDALTRLNALLMHLNSPSGKHTTATLIVARYRPTDRVLAWAQAGHLPPLLVRDGLARTVERPAGILLGATDTPVFGEATLRLQDDDQLLFFTDGLIERPGQDLRTGLQELATTAEALLRTADADSLPALHAALAVTEHRDDVCALHISVPSQRAGD
ncbi:SpoIIE family protein phosphatase [Streptomyces longwoodensis]|uniref:SpoIIE family protein phosphatase n=1 Tax=Streptomyces longwoodensis TaxID=68231 RepID=UPI0030E4F789|nr:SpoIIE family protein phosphatase [Streptomyces longwoodensis]